MLTKSSTEIPDGVLLCPRKRTNRSDLKRISRGPLVKTILFWLPLKKYKCYKCMSTKWVWEKSESHF